LLTWGGLLAFIAMIEDGQVESPLAPVAFTAEMRG